MREPIVRVFREDELPKIFVDAREGVEADAVAGSTTK
jgi:hypothetical protein